jgi:hypothetical protein
VLANAIANITIPALGNWLMVKEEDWYKDLPEWRKVLFWNVHKFDNGWILSLPVPYELGVMFGSVPVAILDGLYGGNPASIGKLVQGALVPHIQGIGTFLPPFLQAALGVEAGHNWFYRGPIVSPWVAEREAAVDQVRPTTSQTAIEIFRAMQPLMQAAGIDNPAELEYLLGTMTGGGTTTGMQLTDEIFSLKDHPGIQPGMLAPFSSFATRFLRQTPHAQGRAVEEFYARERELIDLGDDATFQQRDELARIRSAKTQLSEVRRQMRAGIIDQQTADRQQYEIADRVLRR